MTRRYPAYKAAGALWLGDVPEHWTVAPLRSQFVELKEKNDGLKNSDYLSLVAGKGVMPYAEKGDIGNKMPDDLEKCKIVQAGNFVINSMNFGIGAFGVSNYSGVCSPVYVVLQPTEPKSLGYLNWIFQNREFQETAQSFGNGILAHRSAIGWDELRIMLAAVPPLPEQTAIAAFLDRETAKIDALVAEQRRLIDLLKEKRQAVISHAVTRGLNPAAKLKPSGVDWLGDVPEGWVSCSTGRYASILSGFAFPSTGFSHDEDDTPLLRGVNVGVGELRWDETVYWKRQPDDGLDPWMVREGDLIIGMDRPWVSAGVRVAIVKSNDLPCLLLQRVAAIRTDEGLNQNYLMLHLSSDAFVHFFLPDTTGVSVPHISPSQIKNFPIVVPNRHEQDEIVEYLAHEIAKLDTLTTTAETAITLLQERRAALISAAVTGKIDVRDLVSQEMNVA